MIYDHVVNYNGIYYQAGENVPDDKEKGKSFDLPFSDSEIAFETMEHKYTEKELDEITVKEIRKIAEDKGFTLSKVVRKDIINEFLEKQG